MSAEVMTVTQAPEPLPDHIALIGGGRWARVIADTLCKILPQSSSITMHSMHHAASLRQWAGVAGWSRRVSIHADWPTFGAAPPAIIVANAARDHGSAVRRALLANAPVLVEKPMALNFATAVELAALAREKNGRLAIAHVFSFARYTENFARAMSSLGKVRSVSIRWVDPAVEQRHGEHKSFDAGLPIFADWLPHVYSLLMAAVRGSPVSYEALRLLRGGATLELRLALGDVPCDVFLARNGGRRERRMECVAENGTLTLDFSTEPGTIGNGETIVDADPLWNSGRRPLATLLFSYLRWVAGGPFDTRLDLRAGVKVCELIEQVRTPYLKTMTSWLQQHAANLEQANPDLRYAAAELLQRAAPIAVPDLERDIELMCGFLARTEKENVVSLVEASDPAAMLRSLL